MLAALQVLLHGNAMCVQLLDIRRITASFVATAFSASVLDLL